MLFVPNIKLERITDITVEILKKLNINTLLLDVDNTMSTHHGMVLTDGLTEWIAEMQDNNVKLCVLSNSKEKRVAPFAQKIGLQYISLGLKPLPFGYMRAIKKLKAKKANTAIVGDQIFTDVLGGKIVGIKTVLLTPIKPEDGWSFRLRRTLEKKIINKYNIHTIEH